MARRSSVVPLKRRTPRWFCINTRYGNIHNLVTYPKPLYYVTDQREMKTIKKILGNPAFFDRYYYLLVTRDAVGDFEEIFGVLTPIGADGSAYGMKDKMPAFTGEVERITFGWAQDKRHYDAIMSVKDHDACADGECGEGVDEFDDEVD